ncbi:hypothetical protein AN478_07995 [Thiohalorhabdus denitrificans]|uniref:Lipoprotein n=1 Tax=Thiohalorhabdus denitrificans TaxID=381306 RepID=A0A0P9ENL9_9GAMM|nr:hypothetical protein [Thiohalorhabdus denitrificans]KPV40090.1 hypothetical protein AN478_07995 [Thiohalorhabdus denitrificans]SCY15174.1 hypothetical protein SAMN05661077_1365 [Thiohalorhabdus denitrificans]
MRAWRPASAALVVTLLAGCGTLDRSVPTGSADDLAAFYRYASTLDGRTLTAEYRNFRNWVSEERCTADRLRLAIITLVADSGPPVSADPGEVLGPCTGSSDQLAPHLRNMAFLLKDQLQQRNELFQHAAQLEQRVDQLANEVAESRAAHQELTRQKGELEERLQKLHEQLEALKDIERSIRQRD